MAKTSPTALVVVHSFGSYGKGQVITDPAAIRAVLDGGLAGFVIATSLPVVAPAATAEH